MSRIDLLKQFLDEDPDDSFSRYALAMEYAKLGRLEEAVTEYRSVRDRDPNYVATYYQLGKALENQGDVDAAREAYRAGIAVASRLRDAHTRDELASALGELD
jgi:predicted Zn-dependent protease